MNHKNLISIIALDLVVMVLALGLFIFRYSTVSAMSNLASRATTTPPAVSTAPATAVPRTDKAVVPPLQEPDDAISTTEPFADLPRNIGFVYRNSRARKVEVIGDFNGWVPKPMIKGRDYKWNISIPIPPGEYAYNFVVDGKPIRDPYNSKTCDVGRGFPNSLLKVRSLADEKKTRE